MADEYDRPLDGADVVAHAGGVGGDPAQRVRDGDRRMPRVDQAIDDLVPAGGLGEGAVDEDDGGAHDDLLRVGRPGGGRQALAGSGVSAGAATWLVAQASASSATASQ